MKNSFFNFFGRKTKNETSKEKWCNKCKQMRPIADFHLDKYYADGHHNYCKSCLSDMRKATKEKKAMRALSLNQKVYEGSISDIIRRQRIDTKQTLNDVAEKAGVCMQSIWRAEKNNNMSLDTCQSILKALNLKMVIVDDDEKN